MITNVLLLAGVLLLCLVTWQLVLLNRRLYMLSRQSYKEYLAFISRSTQHCDALLGQLLAEYRKERQL